MDVPGTASLKQARLHLSTEGGDHVYLLEEPGTGQLLRLSEKVARLVLNARALLLGQRRDAGGPEAVAAVSQYLNSLRRAQLDGKKPFNPLFVRLPLFDVRPFQPALAGLARLFFSPGMAVLLGVLTLFAVWLTAATSFAFFDRLGDVFSLEVLLTFAIIAPVLKVFHELGHVLAATRYGVPVRSAGVILIALFPMPFVDCTEADFRAQRRQRIVISLAGLLSDLSIGLLAFLAWHVVEGDWTRQMLANVFIFSTLTTIVFNLNPLMRLDGYFALADALHRRNLHADSAKSLKGFAGALIELRPRAAWSLLRQKAGTIGFATASMIYKIYIVAFIAWMLLPQYLGLGALIVAWGAAVMFLTPVLRGQSAQKRSAHPWRRRAGQLLLLSGLGLIALIPLPYSHVTPITLDVDGTYAIRAGVDGRIIGASETGPVQPGAELMTLGNFETDVRLALNAADQNMFAYVAESLGTRDPIAAQAGLERLAASRALEVELQREVAALTVTATTNGLFQPAPHLRRGAAVNLGDSIGSLLPDAGSAIAHGQLPEIYAEKFTNALTGTEIRLAGRYLTARDGVQVTLSQAEVAAGTPSRRFRLVVTIPEAPQGLRAEQMHLRLVFADEPLWQHAVFLWRRLRLNLQQTEYLSREQTVQ
ncbi:MAG: site-2 protease family protein [Pseudomonadota bacterium]